MSSDCRARGEYVVGHHKPSERACRWSSPFFVMSFRLCFYLFVGFHSMCFYPFVVFHMFCPLVLLFAFPWKFM